jgi:hypothetical protein
MLDLGALAMMTQHIVLQQEEYLYTVQRLAGKHIFLHKADPFMHIFCTG